MNWCSDTTPRHSMELAKLTSELTSSSSELPTEHPETGPTAERPARAEDDKQPKGLGDPERGHSVATAAGGSAGSSFGQQAIND